MRSFGRESELQILSRILGESETGRGGTVLVSGEPGVGKTTLLAELSERAASRGFRILRPLWPISRLGVRENPWIQLVNAIEGTPEALRLVSGDFQPGSRRKGISFGASSGIDRSNADDLGETASAFRRIWTAIRSAAESAPLVVMFDDLIKADNASLRLLADLAPHVRDCSVLLATAYCEEAFADSERRMLIDLLRHSAHNIELRSLTRRGVEELLESLIGHPPGQRLVERVEELTGGNPHLIVESEPLLIDGGESLAESTGLTTIPLGISIAVHERLTNLSAAAGQVLKCAAVIGGRFDPELALGIVGLERDHAEAALSEVENRGIVSAAHAGHYKFSNGFVREVLYRELPPEVRAHTHRRIAAALKMRHPSQIESHSEEIAYNSWLSRDRHSLEDAIGFAQIAGRRFLRNGAFSKASEMFSLALDAVRWRGNEDDLRVCELLTEKGIAERDAGDLRAAEKTFESIINYARRIGDPIRLARLALELPDYHWPLPGFESPRAILLAEDALASLGNGEPALRAMVTARLAASLSYDRTQKRRSEDLAKQSIEIAKNTAAEPKVMLRVLRFRECTLRHPDRHEERLANLSELMTLAHQLSDSIALHEATASTIEALFRLGKIGEAEALVPVFEETARVANRPLYRIFSLVSSAARHAISSPAEKSERIFAEAQTVARDSGISYVMDRCWPAMTLPMIQRDAVAELEEMAEASLRARPNSIIYRALKCWLDARSGKHFEARLRLERLAVEDFADLRLEHDFLAAAALVGQACIRLGSEQSGYATRIYEMLLPYANHLVSIGQISVMGSVSYYLGKLAKFLGRPEVAGEHFRAAVDSSARIESPALILYARFEQANALLRQESLAQKELGRTLLAALEEEIAGGEFGALADQIAASLGTNRDAYTSGRTSPLMLVPDDRQISNDDGNQIGRSMSEATPGSETVNGKSGSKKFKREGEVWYLLYDQRSVRIRHLKGLALISHLLAHRNESVHCVDLTRIVEAQQGHTDAAQTGQVFEIGPLLDREAKQSYRERARELREELEEAIRFNDTGRAEKIEEELRFLTRELARAVGLSGRDRTTGSTSERARLRVTFVIKSAISKIAEHHQSLARHLERTIKTGGYCVYRPEEQDSQWEL